MRSDIYNRIITGLHPEFKVFSQACPLLVPLVEEGWINKRETKMIIRRYLHPLQNNQIDTLVLGCTHYPLLKELIQARIGRHVHLIDSSVEAARHLQKMLARTPRSCKKKRCANGGTYLLCLRPDGLRPTRCGKNLRPPHGVTPRMTLCQRTLKTSARIILSALFILILAGFSGTAAGSEESPVDIGARLQAKYNRIKSLTFDFTQQTSGQLTGRGGRGMERPIS